LIFRGLNFSCNADIGQIGHLWKGANKAGQGAFHTPQTTFEIETNAYFRKCCWDLNPVALFAILGQPGSF
jgi:hypothetical protein